MTWKTIFARYMAITILTTGLVIIAWFLTSLIVNIIFKVEGCQIMGPLDAIGLLVPLVWAAQVVVDFARWSARLFGPHNPQGVGGA